MSIASIRPLETLHNALSLKQLDVFLERMTTTANYRLPLSSPMKIPLQQQMAVLNASAAKGGLPIVSPTNSSFGAWSGPPSFVSSSGPSSPNSSQLDLWLRFTKGAESESTAADFSGPGSCNSFSGPPSPLDPKYYSNNNSL